MPSSAPPKLFPRARPSKVKLLRRPLDATRPRLGGDETPVRAQILEGKWPPRDRNSRWVALRGCCRRCRRRLSGFWPRRGAKPDHLFRHALRADGRHGRSSPNDLLFCCELLPCFAFFMPQESDKSKPQQGRRRRRAKEEQANAPGGEQEEANKNGRESRQHHNNSRRQRASDFSHAIVVSR